MSLRQYRGKRDPARTPEPFDEGAGGGADGPIFVVQRHDARRLHYDFRLERDGALASWAVPKGVPLEPGEQHLAVHVEDHPIEYAKFEGEIPQGNYGAGTVEIWDKGTYELVEEKRNGGLTVRLHGERLNGVWALIPAHLDGKDENWLIVRKREQPTDAAAPGRRYRPMLATLERNVPQGEQWTFEVKWDGYRALAYIRGSEVQLLSRRDNDLTERFASVAKEVAKAIKTPHAVVDGEVCALDDRGRASFSAMQQGGTALVYYVFDVLEVEGVPLVDLTLRERRERLEQLLDRRNRCVRLSETFDDGDALYEAADQQELEGIVAKRLDSRYAEGRRNRDWVKVKTHGRQEFIIAGYTHGGGRRASTFGSLILAVREGDELRYVGNVGTGFDDAEIRRLLGKLKPLRRETSPFRPIPKLPRVRKDQIVWVEPQLVAEVEFARVDARRPPPRVGVPGAARRQGRRGRAPRGARSARGARAARDARPARQARARALEPRQAVLAGRGNREGRPAAVLPRHRAGARAAPRRQAVHDEALPRRLAGQVLLPERRTRAHAGLDPALSRARVDAREATAEEVGQLPARERRARAALDGEHGLHRHEHVVLARSTSPSAPTSCSSTSTPRPTQASPRRCRWRCS